MSSLLITDIKELNLCKISSKQALRGQQMANWTSIENAYLFIENGLISNFGPMAEAPNAASEVISAENKIVLPSFVDSHTHLVFAGSREKEFVARIKGARPVASSRRSLSAALR